MSFFFQILYISPWILKVSLKYRYFCMRLISFCRPSCFHLKTFCFLFVTQFLVMKNTDKNSLGKFWVLIFLLIVIIYVALESRTIQQYFIAWCLDQLLRLISSTPSIYNKDLTMDLHGLTSKSIIHWIMKQLRSTIWLSV